MSLPIESEILNGLVHDREFGRTAIPHLQDEYFTDDGMRTIVCLTKDYISKYQGLPTVDALAIDLQNVKDISQDQFDNAKSYLENVKIPNVDFKRSEEHTCKNTAS